MSDQQPKFDTATFSPSVFDTFQVPISDIVTQSVEDALGASPVADTPAPVEADAPVQADAPASAVTEDVTSESVNEQVVNEQPINEEAEEVDAVHEVADETSVSPELEDAAATAPIQDTVASEPAVAMEETAPQPVVEQPEQEPQTAIATEVSEPETVDAEIVEEQEIGSSAVTSDVEEASIVTEFIEEEEFISTQIDDVLIPPPAAVKPEETSPEQARESTPPVEPTPVATQPVEVIEAVEVPEVASTPEPVQEVAAVQETPPEKPAKEIPPAPAQVAKPVAAERPATAEPAKPVQETKPAPAPQPTPEVVATNAVEDAPESGFRKLALREEVQQAIEASGYTTPTDIQAQIIPHVLEGRDVLAQSQTGTGKTAAFALPILSKIDVAANKPQVLVLAPTRELAMQVADSFTTYGKQIPRLDVAAVYGGQGYDTQLRQLRRGVPIVVGTPGRVIDHIKRRTLDLSELECLVLDEADEMLNMGFLEDVKFVLEQTPAERQVALFSATLPGPIQKIAQQYLNDPVRITIKRKTMTADAIRQRAVFAAHRDKLDVLSRFLDVEETDGVIIFTKTREATVTVAEHLVREGFKAVALNGDMPQNVRERTISQLKASRLDILVATDVAARGLDVSRISHVFNFDVPQDTESYIHRIGRTGRAGRKGEAIILLSNSQRFKLKQIERLTKQPIQVVAAPTADDINAARVVRFKQKITEVIDGKDLTQFTEMLKEYATESGKSMEEIAAAMAEIGQNGRPFFIQERQRRNQKEDRFSRDRDDRGQRSGRERDDRFGNDRDERPSRQPRRAGRVEAGMDRYRIEVGHDDGVKPGNIVGAVANEGGIEGEFIGPINIFGHYSTIDLPEGMPREVFEILQQVRVAGKQLRIRRASEADNHGESGGHGGGGGGRNFKPRGPKRFGGKGKPRSGGSGGNFDHRKRRRPGN